MNETHSFEIIECR